LKLNAQVAAKSQPFRSSQPRANQFIVENASRKTALHDHQQLNMVFQVPLEKKVGREDETTDKPKNKNQPISIRNLTTHPKVRDKKWASRQYVDFRLIFT
jgi:hypothetical protein